VTGGPRQEGGGGPLDVVLRAGRAVVLGGDGTEVERAAAVGVRDGRVAVVTDVAAPLDAVREVVVPDGVVLLPGLVDTHVHLQDPGHPGWEDFTSGTAAAALGGVTTVVDMPLDCEPVTVDPAALAVKVAAATGRVHVDVGFWAGLTPDSLPLLGDLLAAGALGAKCFLVDPGTPGFAPLTAAGLEAALSAARALDAVVLVHAEDAGPSPDGSSPGDPGPSYASWLAARPPALEDAAVARVVEAVARTGGRAHVVHVSSASAAALVAAAKARGLPLTAETCPHYLVLAAEDVPATATGFDPRFTVAPPLRERAHAAALWEALRAGTLDLVVSDHSPGGGDGGPPGIASLQLGLPLVWTVARPRGVALTDVVRWMCRAPATLAGLASPAGRRKGAITPGADADLCLFAPDRRAAVDPRALAQRRPDTPYTGRQLTGVVTGTWLAGRPVDVRGRPRGQVLLARPHGKES